MTNAYNHAKKELWILEKKYPDSVVNDFKKEILELCERFGQSGQSGGSAPFVAHSLGTVIKKLCLQEVISPLTGEDKEWADVMGGMKQNVRCHGLFKNKDGESYYIDAIVFRGPDNIMFTGICDGVESRGWVNAWPFEPVTFYIDVEKVPYLGVSTDDGAFKDDKDGKVYVWRIKDKEKQLDRVYKHYKKPGPQLKLIK